MSNAAGPPRPSLVALVALFIASGAAGLVYEVAWSRRLELTFGSSTHSIGTVLAAYMAGLGLGAFLFGRLADRPGSPAKRYAALEAGIGVYGLLAPWMLDLVDAAFVAISQSTGSSGGVPTKATLGLLALAPPTILMGGTLPVLVRALVRGRDDAGRVTGLLYGVNTLGAVLGALLAGLWLVPAIGMDHASRVMGVVNLALAGIALALGPRLAPMITEEAPPDASAAAPAAAAPDAATASALIMDARIAATAAFACGAVALGLEVAWSRAFGLLLGSTGHGFTIVLAATLLGIGLGSLLTTGRAGAARISPFDGLTTALLLLGLATLGFVQLYDDLPQVVVELVHRGGLTTPPRSYEATLAMLFTGAALILLPATIALGAAFPMCVELGTPAARVGGRSLGRLYLVNTVGAILGSLGTTFALVPAIGTQGVLRLGGALAALGGAGVSLAAVSRGIAPERRGRLVASLGLVLALALALAPAWDRMVLDAGPLRPRGMVPDVSPGDLQSNLRHGGTRLLFAEDGLNAYVTVRGAGQGRALYISGKPDASSLGDMATQLLVGLVPLLSRPEPPRALVVGVGSGVSVRVLADAAQRVDVVEIEPAVISAANAHFRPENHGALERPNVRILIEDARTILMAPPGDVADGWDVICNEPTNPLVSGVANLFTFEHHTRIRSRLRPGGVCLQWIQLYHSTDEIVRRMIRTFQAVFPQVELWQACGPDLLLIGSEEPLRYDPAAAGALVARHAALQRDLWPHLYARSPEDLWARYLVDDRALREVIGPGELLHDRLPVLEGLAARAGFTNSMAHGIRAQILARALARPRVGPVFQGPPGVEDGGLDPTAMRLARARVFCMEAMPPDVRRQALEGLVGPEPELLGARVDREPTLAQLEALSARWPDDPDITLLRAVALVEAVRLEDAAALLPGIEAGLARRGERRAALHLVRARTTPVTSLEGAERVVADAMAGLDVILPSEQDRYRMPLIGQLARCSTVGDAAVKALTARVEREPSDGELACVLANMHLRRGDLRLCADLVNQLIEEHAAGWDRAVRLLDLEMRAQGDDPSLDDALDAFRDDFPQEAARNARVAAIQRLADER